MSQNKGDPLPAANRKICESGELLALQIDRRTQLERIRAGGRKKCALDTPHPWNNTPVSESNDKFHLHAHLSAQSLHNSHEVGALRPRWHAIHDADAACRGFEFSL